MTQTEYAGRIETVFQDIFKKFKTAMPNLTFIESVCIKHDVKITTVLIIGGWNVESLIIRNPK